MGLVALKEEEEAVAASCKPGREVLPEANPASTLILDFQPLGL